MTLTSPEFSRCNEEDPCSDPTMPPSCGLYTSRYLGDWDPDHQCNRLYSASLEYVLVLHTNSNMVIYRTAGSNATEQPTEVVWSADTAFGNDARSLLLYRDGSWAIATARGLVSMFERFDRVGVYYKNNANYELAPFMLRLGNDGTVRLVNRLGHVAWSSQMLEAQPPSPPSDAAAPPNFPPPRICNPGSVYIIIIILTREAKHLRVG